MLRLAKPKNVAVISAFAKLPCAILANVKNEPLSLLPTKEALARSALVKFPDKIRALLKFTPGKTASFIHAYDKLLWANDPL